MSLPQIPATVETELALLLGIMSFVGWMGFIAFYCYWRAAMAGWEKANRRNERNLRDWNQSSKAWEDVCRQQSEAWIGYHAAAMEAQRFGLPHAEPATPQPVPAGGLCDHDWVPTPRGGHRCLKCDSLLED